MFPENTSPDAWKAVFAKLAAHKYFGNTGRHWHHCRKLKFICYAGMSYGPMEAVQLRLMEAFSFHQAQGPMFCTAAWHGAEPDDFH